MADEEKKHEEEEDLQTKGYSLSIDSWMTVLSSEINREIEVLLHVLSASLILISIVIVFILGYVAFLMDLLTILKESEFASANLPALIEGAELWRSALGIILFFYLISAGIFAWVTQKRIETLEDIRDGAISRNRDLEEICERWEQYRKDRKANFLDYLSYSRKKRLMRKAKRI